MPTLRLTHHVQRVTSHESLKKKGEPGSPFFENLAEWTGLEPATPGVTGRYSNQLNYHSNRNAEC